MSDFPFLWGAATSSHQVEGNNQKNDWWAWEQEGHIEGGVGSGLATDHWNRYKEDLKLAADLGMNTYRFSVEWSRVEPEDGRFDPVALEWYSSLIQECERLGLKPMLTLHHFTSPKWFADRGGFTWDKSPERFLEYVRQVIKKVGSRVPLWCTVNEPMVLISGTYLGKFMPPARTSPVEAALACHHLLKAHALAYDLIHKEMTDRQGPWKDHPLQVGIAHNMLDFMPDRKWHLIERLLAGAIHRFYNRSWLEAITGGKQRFGVPGLVPNAKPVKEALGRKTADFIGVNYYTKAYVQWHPKVMSPESLSGVPVGMVFARKTEDASDVGWALHPDGFRKMLRFAAKYRLPLYITENGIADHKDRLRKKYLSSHLNEVALAIQSGIDIRGYYHWSLLDNFEWIKGFGPRFGLVQVDYKTMKRTPTESAQLYKQIIQSHEAYAGKPNPEVFRDLLK